MWSDVPSIGILSLFTLLPFLVASGTCFVKFSIVFVMVRNALGLQQVPSNMTLNGVALLISLFVMLPVASAVMDAYQANPVNFGDPNSVRRFLDDGLSPYRDYLVKYADPQLTQFFAREEVGRDAGDIGAGGGVTVGQPQHHSQRQVGAPADLADRGDLRTQPVGVHRRADLQPVRAAGLGSLGVGRMQRDDLQQGAHPAHDRAPPGAHGADPPEKAIALAPERLYRSTRTF